MGQDALDVLLFSGECGKRQLLWPDVTRPDFDVFGERDVPVERLALVSCLHFKEQGSPVIQDFLINRAPFPSRSLSVL